MVWCAISQKSVKKTLQKLDTRCKFKIEYQGYKRGKRQKPEETPFVFGGMLREPEKQFVTSYTTTLLDLLKVGTSTPLKLSKNYPFGIILQSSTPLMVSGGNLAQTGQTCDQNGVTKVRLLLQFFKNKAGCFWHHIPNTPIMNVQTH